MDQQTKPNKDSERGVDPTSTGRSTGANGLSTNTPSSQTPSRDDLFAIHAVCTQFESVWHTSTRCTIEEIAATSSIENRPALLESLIRSELEMRELEPNPQLLEEFHHRFPNDSESIRLAFLSSEDRGALEASELEMLPVSATSSNQSTLQSSVHSFKALPSKLGPYQILGEFARGGMGIIYKARHADLDRIVALKVIKSGQLASQSELSRFHNEAKAIASLDHPNIVPVFEVGEHSGFHYLAMPFIDGENLADRIREHPLKPRAAAEIAYQIAVAVAYAHERGIIHRDLKPRNILVEDSGVVRVTDFGLAKSIHLDPNEEANQNLTITGQVVGTPAYMSPEQALGSTSTQSDIYAIGSILYALTTGRPPFQSASLLETLRQLQDTEPVEPRRLNVQIPRDLETITLKCLRKGPESRYETATDLACDLRLFLDEKPIKARPVSPLERLFRWGKRQPVIAGLILTTFLSLIAGLAFSIIYYSLARSNEKLASANLDIASATVKKYLTEVASSPELKEQGLETLRTSLLSTARAFYEQLELQPGQDEKLQSKLSETRFNLALIRFELGDLGESRALFDLALESYRSLAKRFRNNHEYNRNIATVLQERAKIKGLNFVDDLKEATSVFRKVYSATQLREDLIRMTASVAALGIYYTNVAAAKDEESTFAEVEKRSEELLPMAGNLDKKEDLLVLFQVFDQLALYLQLHGEFQRAEKWLMAIVDLGERIVSQNPNDPVLLRSLARANKTLVQVFAKTMKLDDAKLRFEKADSLYQRLTEEHPLVLEYLDGQANNLLNGGSLQYKRRDLSSAMELLQRAVAAQNRLIEKRPDFSEYRVGLPACYSSLGMVSNEQGKIDEAFAFLRKGIEAQDVVASLRPDDQGIAFFGASLTGNLANAYQTQRRHEEAAPVYIAAIEKTRRLVDQNPSAEDFTRALAIMTLNQAANARKLGQTTQATESYMNSRLLFEKLLSRLPDSLEYQKLLLHIQSGLGQLYVEQYAFEDALQELSAANERLLKLIELAKDAGPYQNNIGIISLGLAEVASQQDRLVESLNLTDKAISAFTNNLAVLGNAKATVTLPVRESLCTSHRLKALVLLKMQKFEEATEECNKAIGFDTGNQSFSAISMLARVRAAAGDSSNAEVALQRIDPAVDLSFDTLIDMATTQMILTKSNSQAVEPKLLDQVRELLSRASKRDAKRFSFAIKSPEFSEIGNLNE